MKEVLFSSTREDQIPICNTQHFSCIFWGFGERNNVISTYGFMLMGGRGVQVGLEAAGAIWGGGRGLPLISRVKTEYDCFRVQSMR